MTNPIGYKLFLPAIIASIRAKDNKDGQLTNPEVEAIVAVVYRDSVIDFMRDSELYRVEIPIDLYKDVKRYEIQPPEGYFIEGVLSMKPHKTKVPKYILHGEDNLTLTCCPVKDVDNAFFAEVSLVPKRRSLCEFDEDFIDKYYDVILDRMFFKLTSMPARIWRALGLSNRYEKMYRNGVSRVKRKELTGDTIIKISTRRLSDNVSSC